MTSVGQRVPRTQSANKIGGMSNVESMRQFNYFGNNPPLPNGDMDEDEEILKQEIENIMMQQTGGVPLGGKHDRFDQNIVNMTTSNFGDKHRT